MTLNKNVTPESFLEKIICNENEYDIRTPQFLLDDLEKMITRAFFFSYKTDENTYNYKLVTDIIYNEKTRLVARFKDFLIYDDISEFFRRFYSQEESYPRLKKLSLFYENFSRIFPNYLSIPESKFLYRNIRKKQKIIDKLNQIQEENKLNHEAQIEKIKEIQEKKQNEEYEDQDKESEFDNTIFNTDVKNSILKYEPEIPKNLKLLDKIKNKLDFSEDSRTLEKKGQNAENLLTMEKDSFISEIENSLCRRQDTFNENFDFNSNKNGFPKVIKNSDIRLHVIKNNLNTYNSSFKENKKINEIKINEIYNYLEDDNFLNEKDEENNVIRLRSGNFNHNSIKEELDFLREEKKGSNKIHNNQIKPTQKNHIDTLISASLNLESSLMNNNTNKYTNLEINKSDSFSDIIRQLEKNDYEGNNLKTINTTNNLTRDNKDEEKLNNCNKNILQDFKKKYNKENRQENSIGENKENKTKAKKTSAKIRNNFVNRQQQENFSTNFLIKNFPKFLVEENSNKKNETNFLTENYHNKLIEANQIYKGFIDNFKNAKKIQKNSSIKTKKFYQLQNFISQKRILFHSFSISENEKNLKNDNLIKGILCEKYYLNYIKGKKKFNKKKENFEVFEYLKKINKISNFNFDFEEIENSGNEVKTQNLNFDMKNYFNKFSEKDKRNIQLNTIGDNKTSLVRYESMNSEINSNSNFDEKNDYKTHEENFKTIPNLIIPPNSYVNINNNFYNLYIKPEGKEISEISNSNFKTNFKQKQTDKEYINFLKVNRLEINEKEKERDNQCFSTPRKKDQNGKNVYDKVIRILQDSSKPKNKNFLNYNNINAKIEEKRDFNTRINNILYENSNEKIINFDQNKNFPNKNLKNPNENSQKNNQNSKAGKILIKEKKISEEFSTLQHKKNNFDSIKNDNYNKNQYNNIFSDVKREKELENNFENKKSKIPSENKNEKKQIFNSNKISKNQIEKIKVKKDFQKILESQINFELNSTVSNNSNININTENSERKNYVSNVNTINYGDNGSSIEQNTISNYNYHKEKNENFLTARISDNKKKRRILSGYQSLNEKTQMTTYKVNNNIAENLTSKLNNANNNNNYQITSYGHGKIQNNSASNNKSRTKERKIFDNKNFYKKENSSLINIRENHDKIKEKEKINNLKNEISKIFNTNKISLSNKISNYDSSIKGFGKTISKLNNNTNIYKTNINSSQKKQKADSNRNNQKKINLVNGKIILSENINNYNNNLHSRNNLSIQNNTAMSKILNLNDSCNNNITKISANKATFNYNTNSNMIIDKENNHNRKQGSLHPQSEKKSDNNFEKILANRFSGNSKNFHTKNNSSLSNNNFERNSKEKISNNNSIIKIKIAENPENNNEAKINQNYFKTNSQKYFENNKITNSNSNLIMKNVSNTINLEKNTKEKIFSSLSNTKNFEYYKGSIERNSLKIPNQQENFNAENFKQKQNLINNYVSNKSNRINSLLGSDSKTENIKNADRQQNVIHISKKNNQQNNFNFNSAKNEVIKNSSKNNFDKNPQNENIENNTKMNLNNSNYKYENINQVKNSLVKQISIGKNEDNANEFNNKNLVMNHKKEYSSPFFDKSSLNKIPIEFNNLKREVQSHSNKLENNSKFISKFNKNKNENSTSNKDLLNAKEYYTPNLKRNNASKEINNNNNNVSNISRKSKNNSKLNHSKNNNLNKDIMNANSNANNQNIFSPSNNNKMQINNLYENKIYVNNNNNLTNYKSKKSQIEEFTEEKTRNMKYASDKIVNSIKENSIKKDYNTNSINNFISVKSSNTNTISQNFENKNKISVTINKNKNINAGNNNMANYSIKSQNNEKIKSINFNNLLNLNSNNLNNNGNLLNSTSKGNNYRNNNANSNNNFASPNQKDDNFNKINKEGTKTVLQKKIGSAVFEKFSSKMKYGTNMKE